MATILLSAVGAAVGSTFGGGTILGLTGAVIGQAVGATVGRVIDQKVLGIGSEAVEFGKVDRFRVMGASEGAAIPQVWGRVRVSGQVIWASRFQENIHKSGGGKGTSSGSVKEYSYTVSLAIALCSGEILRVGRVWADGNEIEPESLNLRVYSGTETQVSDPKIEAVEGAGLAPSYRGIAYIVIEDLDLSAFGSRVPQFSFEIIRPVQNLASDKDAGLSTTIPGVCLIPGTGEYALATTPVHYSLGLSSKRSANLNTIGGKTDFTVSLDQLVEELPNCGTVSMVATWFAGDLRCASCTIKPKVEQKENDGVEMPWVVSGVNRVDAETIADLDGRPVYGGTPADKSVIEAIQAARAAGKKVTFYPFILMDQLDGNELPDPWTGALGQPALPWRGRITLNNAPGTSETSDATHSAELEVATFFGNVQNSQISHDGQSVAYNGPVDWGFRRFILHYAHLCAAAGGVDAFCIGSELRSLTQIRGPGNSFPAVEALCSLAGDVKLVLGEETKLTYAADWSEYFGYHVGEDVFFHLDPLWADPSIDFIGIDNYMPISDWRDGFDHADATWGDVHNVDYLKANIAGGEGYDWYYANQADEAAQRRSPIRDTAHGEDWVFRFKDLKGWWLSSHHNRVGGIRASTPTEWVAGSKPFRFTEFGCAAVDKATNQPNLFVDAKSSESGLPKYSNGLRDDLSQFSYHQAMYGYWDDAANNPAAVLYDGRMVDFANSTAWAWDARPFPAFPANTALWSDGGNYDTGHWLNGRSSSVSLSALFQEVCGTSGIAPLDTGRAYGIVRGYSLSEVASARSILQPLTLAMAVDAIEREGVLRFQTRKALPAARIDAGMLAVSSELGGRIERTRAGEVETPALLRISFNEAESDFATTTVSATLPGGGGVGVSQSELPLTLTSTEAIMIAERWMAEARAGQETARFALPNSRLGLGTGDTVTIDRINYRVDRVEQSILQTLETVRVDPLIYEPASVVSDTRTWQAAVPSLPVYPVILDVPQLRENDQSYAPYACVGANPWAGQISVWSSPADADYLLNRVFDQSAVVGLTQNDLHSSDPGRWDRGVSLRVKLDSGYLSSATEITVYSGENTAFIGNGTASNWEIFQFKSATLVEPKTYEISMRLRGQAGTDGLVPPVWPAGSVFIFMNNAVQQLSMPLSARGLTRYYRFGLSVKGYNNANTILRSEALQSVGLRPYSVAHLKASESSSGDILLNWTRRTRVDGDSWQSVEVPLAETTEGYLVRVEVDNTTVRETTVSTPNWTYKAEQQTVDAISGSIKLSVAQISQSFGYGPFKSTYFAS